jgi:hypothetical protein
VAELARVVTGWTVRSMMKIHDGGAPGLVFASIV